MNHDETLTPFFTPQGVVIIGASQNPTKLGFGIARNLVQSGYPGAVHFVSVKGGTLLERPIHNTIAAVPDPVDLAVILIPAPFVPQSLAECGERGIRAAIIASGGFREVGAEGAELEAECLRIARKHNIRLIGPNCIGILDNHLPLDTTFLPPPRLPAGDIAFLAHSGAICAAVGDWARGQGFGFSRLVSLGNQADVQETDLLPLVAADPHTKVITLYMEGVGNGRAFVHAAQQTAREKPILALKVGRSASGQKAAASHTGALAGSESAYDAAFRRAGVIRATNTEEMFDWAKALAWCPLPQGRRVAVLTNAGGPGVTAADALEANGLTLAEFQPETRQSLTKLLPPAASIQNPVDMLASATPEQYANCLQVVLDDPGVDSAMLIIPPPPMFATGAVARAVIPVIYTASKPVVVALMGSTMIQEAVAHFRAAQVPEYRFPERAAAALAVLSQRAEWLARPLQEPIQIDDVDKETVQAILAANKLSALPQSDLHAMLTAYGIPVPPIKLAQTAEEAAQTAQEMGFPVAMKVASPDISHKSDVGGVRLNLADAAAVAAAFGEMMTGVQAAFPEARIDGVDIQPMIADGQEVIIGVVRDPQFGLVLMFGSGGVEVEGLKDIAFALAPITQQEAETMLQSTWAGRKLGGYRQIKAGDATAVTDILIRLGQLAADFPQLAEIEINPVRVLAKGAWAIDVRARI
ncbi:MAG: acetate--CoA ligase family protein [Ardenticatenaceae bacterium]|nr:acetate--CoA ligase family protein [Ardenticatenaceae bacterium]MCB9442706.1 acetate--CoA ligase family protein [Ardenticatenaceae bacterium]